MVERRLGRGLDFFLSSSSGADADDAAAGEGVTTVELDGLEQVLTATGPDEATVAAEWERMRGLLGFLYSTPAYWPSLEMFGWQDRGERLQAMTRAGEWQTVTVPIAEMVRQYFGTPIRGSLLPSEVSGVEFYIYDKQAGPFQLEVQKIEAVRSRTN